MRPIRFDEYRVMPWKNGGGSTTEILVQPPAASLEEFDWRVSMATITEDGPFSDFPGIDRTLTLLVGPRLVLAFEGAPLVALTPEDPTIRFAGEDVVSAAVPEGAVSDFNVMTRRARCGHLLERFAIAREAELERVGSATLLFLAAGDRVICRSDSGNDIVLGERDSLLLDGTDAVRWRLSASAPALFIRADIFPAAGSGSGA